VDISNLLSAYMYNSGALVQEYFVFNQMNS